MPSIRLAFCWAHARRPFYKFYTSTQSPLAAEVLAGIAKLYAIEADIRDQPPDLRQAVRQVRSPLLVEDLHFWLQTTCRACLAGRTWPKPYGMYCAIGTG